MDDAHALIVRPIAEGYQVISGHHRWLAAKQSGIDAVQCWVREMSDDEAYMQLVLCNTQSELHPLEEGKHAAESGMDLKAYAEKAGKARETLSKKVMAFRVLSVVHMDHEDIRDSWRCLAEIHAAPQWAWSALVERMAAERWTVERTRSQVTAFKDCAYRVIACESLTVLCFGCVSNSHKGPTIEDDGGAAAETVREAHIGRHAAGQGVAHRRRLRSPAGGLPRIARRGRLATRGRCCAEKAAACGLHRSITTTAGLLATER
ncbi:MAG: hypothetical protein FJ189_02545 [Gammaproteobacteria bacterium]|nr:hypothetical protein [Gammaproteobacteria bacterium]